MKTETEEVIFKGKRYVGQDRDGLPVFVDIQYVRDSGKSRLSITGYAQGKFDHAYGGQIVEEIRKREGWRKLAAPAGALDHLAALWERWHLNDMRAACEHQRAAGWLVKATQDATLYYWRMTSEAMAKQKAAEEAAQKALIAGRPFTPTASQSRYAAMPYEKVTTTEKPSAGTLEYEPRTPLYSGASGPKEIKKLGWLTKEEHPDGILSKPCPECGYKYGSEWRYEAVPDEVISWLRAFVTEDGAHPTPKAPPSFCEGSAHKKAPTAEDVLGCLISDAQSFENLRGFEEWAQEYGGEMDTPKARKAARRTYNAVEEQTEKLREFLGHELFTLAMEGRST